MGKCHSSQLYSTCFVENELKILGLSKERGVVVVVDIACSVSHLLFI